MFVRNIRPWRKLITAESINSPYLDIVQALFHFFFLSHITLLVLTFIFFFYSCTGALKFHIILERGCI